MMRCPYCNQAAHVRTSRYLSEYVKQIYLQCVNVFCSTTFRTIESIDEVIRPPAEEKPEPPKTVPDTTPRILDCARSSLRY
ncbi:ogr/Delta-like zinc finger family protein [Escherichia coli]|uniref:ogr/Delta-like zinc finger family protein n=1 Tax=Escherichia coli TaxID=562 RepID=UPI000B7DE3BA|nr:ogr/Delta-like zinc finger family protein [Escherichia coli]